MLYEVITVLSQLDYKLRELKRPVEQVKEASDRVEELAKVGVSGSAGSEPNVVVKPAGVITSYSIHYTKLYDVR